MDKAAYQARLWGAVHCASDAVPGPYAGAYHTLHTLSAGFNIAEPGLQLNAAPNSGMFTTTPLMRYFAGECGSV
ncbi:MAG: hypothetical protein WBW69_03455, partial [Candidatus Korobacteraceae bacterium]